MERSREDYILDLSSTRPPAGARSQAEQTQGFQGRPWLAIKWTCCGAYSRVYRNQAGDAYAGRCPRCGKSVNVPIGEGGTSNRFFEAG